MKILIKYWLPDIDTGFPGNVHIKGINWKWRELGSGEELEKRKEALKCAMDKKKTLRWAVKYDFNEVPKLPTASEFISAAGMTIDGWKAERFEKAAIRFGNNLNPMAYKPIEREIEAAKED